MGAVEHAGPIRDVRSVPLADGLVKFSMPLNTPFMPVTFKAPQADGRVEALGAAEHAGHVRDVRSVPMADGLIEAIRTVKLTFKYHPVFARYNFPRFARYVVHVFARHIPLSIAKYTSQVCAGYTFPNLRDILSKHQRKTPSKDGLQSGGIVITTLTY